MKQLSAFFAGLIFAIGLVLSGMTQPSKVVGFLDFFGNWDPSLAFVMGGAVLINTLLYWLITRRRQRPLLSLNFKIPTTTQIDWRLVGGSALFGIGWGLAGYCPGPGIVSLVSLQTPALIFVLSMAAGMIGYQLILKFTQVRTAL